MNSSDVINQKKDKNRRKIRRFILIPLIVLLLYLALVNFLVSVALIPSFMQKFAFVDSITQQCLDEQVKSNDIDANISYGTKIFQEWLGKVEMREERILSEDGYQLVGTSFFPADDSINPHKWALILHGYTGNKESMYGYARMYYNEGYHSLVPDLRTQGESEGDYIGMGWTDHYDAALWVKRILEIDPQAEIVLHGQSMGASTVLLMTGEEDLSDHIFAAVSEAAYTDAYSMFGDKVTEWFHLPAFPIVDTAVAMLRLRGGYNLKDASPIDAVKKSSTPTIFIHGDQDAMISVNMAYQLYDAAACPKDLLIIKGAGHAQCKAKEPSLFANRIFEFLEKMED